MTLKQQNANFFVCYFFLSSFSRTRGSQTVCGQVFFSSGSINDSYSDVCVVHSDSLQSTRERGFVLFPLMLVFD